MINIKDTSVLNVIGFTELFFQAKQIVTRNYDTFGTYLLLACIYFILTFSITVILRAVEKKMDGKKDYKVMGSQPIDTLGYVQTESASGEASNYGRNY